MRLSEVKWGGWTIAQQGAAIHYRPQRSCGQGYVFTGVCDSVHRGGLPQCMLGYCPPEGGTPPKKEPPKKETPCQGDPPEGGTPLEGGTPHQGDPKRRPPKGEPQEGDPPAKETPPPGPHPRGELRGSGPGPHPRGKLRGIRSRPTPKGEIEGDQIQVHTQGGNWGRSDPGPCPREKLRGIRSRPSPLRSRLRHTVNERLVRILLECILVSINVSCNTIRLVLYRWSFWIIRSSTAPLPLCHCH